jgi:dihydrofolate reductase
VHARAFRSLGFTTWALAVESIMSTVEVDISMSLDGFITGPITKEHPGLGEGGDILHAWLREPAGQRLITETFAATGAVITSRKVYDLTKGWGDTGFFHLPVFVLTHRPHDPVVKRAAPPNTGDWQATIEQHLQKSGHGATTFTFVTDGIASAVAQARAAAGAKKVHIMGGASVIQQALQAALVDELHLHVAPIVLGAGTRLFDGLVGSIELRRTAVLESEHATHLRFRAMR